jgi:predicted ArsR family transcriptional regulator
MSNSSDSDPQTPVCDLNIPLDRDIFLRTLLGHLSGTLEDVVGFDEASGFISIVGQHVGEWIDRDYRKALKVSRLSRDQLAQVLVDLKRRIRGDFFIISQDEEKIVLGNRACPFGDPVKGRNSLCMMTSNVFGTITAENLGYAKVALHETIARGDPGCRIVIYLTESAESAADSGNEYFSS